MKYRLPRNISEELKNYSDNLIYAASQSGKWYKNLFYSVLVSGLNYPDIFHLCILTFLDEIKIVSSHKEEIKFAHENNFEVNVWSFLKEDDLFSDQQTSGVFSVVEMKLPTCNVMTTLQNSNIVSFVVHGMQYNTMIQSQNLRSTLWLHLVALNILQVTLFRVSGYYKMGTIVIATLKSFVTMKGNNPWKLLAQCLVYSKHSINVSYYFNHVHVHLLTIIVFMYSIALDKEHIEVRVVIN